MNIRTYLYVPDLISCSQIKTTDKNYQTSPAIFRILTWPLG